MGLSCKYVSYLLDELIISEHGSGFGVHVLSVVFCEFYEQETEGGEKKKVLTKKARKALAKAEREREQAVAAAFYREFWPENV